MAESPQFKVDEYTVEPPEVNTGVAHRRVTCQECGWTTVLLEDEEVTVEQVQPGHAEHHAAITPEAEVWFREQREAAQEGS